MNTHQAHRHNAKKAKYERQFARTAANKARRIKKQEEIAAKKRTEK